ncbi:MAG: M15 family metallopeptidase [Treponema sp.]|nr:M15 family metallopeptidase [Treponema sp.]
MLKKNLLLVLVLFSIFLTGSTNEAEETVFLLGSFENPIIDSDMTYEEAFFGLSAQCPPHIRERQRLITVKYYSFDGKVHQGQLVIDMDLIDDIEFAFSEALKEKFSIHSVIPISHSNFRWNDNLSMTANNTSAFNYRMIAGTQTLSMHARGRAVDINPVQNPYIRGNVRLPANSTYNPNTIGTLTNDNIIVKSLVSRGWTWGGNWTALKDYQHLEKN